MTSGRSPDMGAALGLILGIGLFLIWSSRTRPRPEVVARARWLTTREEALRQAGLDGIGAVQLIVTQALCFLVATLLVVAITSTISVALCFGAFAAYLPVAVVARLRRRRQTAL